MTAAISSVIASLIEKAAVDNGFDQELPREGDWLSFASTQCPLRIWLGSAGDGVLAAFSKRNVAQALAGYGMSMTASLPKDALGSCTVTGIPALHRLLRRAFQLSKTLPDELLHTFERHIAALPKTTEAERLVVQRVGQNVFRQGLLEFWEGRCAITGSRFPSCCARATSSLGRTATATPSALTSTTVCCLRRSSTPHSTAVSSP